MMEFWDCLYLNSQIWPPLVVASSLNVSNGGGNCLFWGETQLPDNNFGQSNSSVDCSPLMFFCSVADIENWVHTMMEFWDCLCLNLMAEMDFESQFWVKKQ